MIKKYNRFWFSGYLYVFIQILNLICVRDGLLKVIEQIYKMNQKAWRFNLTNIRFLISYTDCNYKILKIHLYNFSSTQNF